MEIQIAELSVRRDERGYVFEPLSEVLLQHQKNVHVVVTQPGKVRGNHYHRDGAETLVVQGPALVRYREEGNAVDRPVMAGSVVRFVFPPGVPHAIQNTGTRPGLLVAFTTQIHNPSDPDTVWDPLIED